MNRYSNLPTLRDLETLKTRYINVKYPGIPISPLDIYVFVAQGDRYDTLARQFYGDSSLWWVIASANNSKKDGLIVEQGVQLRIPAKSSDVQGLFDNLNNER